MSRKTKIYYTNLLKRYFEKEQDLTGTAIELKVDSVGVAIVDAEPEDCVCHRRFIRPKTTGQRVNIQRSQHH